MARSKKRGRRTREGTLGIPGLPKETMLRGDPGSPMVDGVRVEKLLEDETPPGWDDRVKALEDRG